MRSVYKVAATAAVVVGLAATMSSPAFGDPPNGVNPTSKAIVGVGSDTTEYFLDQLALSYDNKATPPTSPLYSYDATGSSPITTKQGATSIPRPDGSSAGITALVNNDKSTVDFARSSRARGASDSASINFVAFAKDAVTVATEATTNAAQGITTQDLQEIYTCTATTWNQIGGTSGATIQPFLPQLGSGTRAFFEAAIGITDAQVGSCVNQTVQENEGTDPQIQGNANAILPYSVAKYIAQVYHSTGSGANDFGTDVHGNTVLRTLNGSKPTTGSAPKVTINPSFTPSFIRTVYNVVRKASTSDGIPGYLDPIFGKTGYLCKKSAAIVKDYGFLPLSGSQCGAVS